MRQTIDNKRRQKAIVVKTETKKVRANFSRNHPGLTQRTILDRVSAINLRLRPSFSIERY